MIGGKIDVIVHKAHSLRILKENDLKLPFITTDISGHVYFLGKSR